jgi:predicted nucleotidyltransferase
MNLNKHKISQDMLNTISAYLKRHGAKKISLFGSYSKGEQNINSDLDILVEFSQRKSLIKLIRIERELSEELNIKIDLLTEKSVSPYILHSIRNQIIPITE